MLGDAMTSDYLPRPYIGPWLCSDRSYLSSEIDAVIDTIAAREPRVQAWCDNETLAEKRARLTAALETVAASQPLCGLLVGVKDIVTSAELPTRCGSALPAEEFPGNDAAAVATLRAAGALIVGKTVTAELASFAPGPTRNPWNLNHTPGGSSSGSAAAVAAGMCHVALGTQTVGSIIRPAAYCGVYGYKPTIGRIDTAGVVTFSQTVDHLGLIGCKNADLALVASQLVAGWQSNIAAPESFALLVPPEAWLTAVEPAARAAFDAALARLTGAGYRVATLRLQIDPREIAEHHGHLTAYEFAHNHADRVRRHAALLRAPSRRILQAGRAAGRRRYEAALRFRDHFRAAIASTLAEAGPSFVLAPSAPGPAPRGIHATGDPVLNLPWTNAGTPVIQMPLTTLLPAGGTTELPVGVQVIAAEGQDEALFDAVQRIESVLAGERIGA